MISGARESRFVLPVPPHDDIASINLPLPRVIASSSLGQICAWTGALSATPLRGRQRACVISAGTREACPHSGRHHDYRSRVDTLTGELHITTDIGTKRPWSTLLGVVPRNLQMLIAFTPDKTDEPLGSTKAMSTSRSSQAIEHAGQRTDYLWRCLKFDRARSQPRLVAAEFVLSDCRQIAVGAVGV